MTNPHAPIGLYVHIPFCVRKCFYCDFNSGPAHAGIRQAQLQALESEVRSSPWRGRKGRTLFFGGGTPSELKLPEVQRLVQALEASFQLEANTERSMECNPGTLTRSFLGGIRQLGFNRISLGIQSFEDDHLAALGRIHTAQEAAESFMQVRRAGFDNVNLDLMFALPHQTLAQWASDLQKAIDLEPEHLSLYNLTIEANTDFGRRQTAGLLKEVDEDLAADMYECALEMTASAGYEQYEISNFAKPGYRCRHNLVYWQNQPYLGFGLSAASYMDGTRWSNTGHWGEYAAAATAGQIPRASEEHLEGKAAMGEEIMLRLRIAEGFSTEELSRKYGLSVEAEFGPAIERFISQNLLHREGSRLFLTRSGKLVANAVCSEFLEG